MTIDSEIHRVSESEEPKPDIPDPERLSQDNKKSIEKARSMVGDLKSVEEHERTILDG
jgi:hypothetical protein